MGVIAIGRLSFDASLKIHYSGLCSSTKGGKSGNHMGVALYVRHLAREVDRKNGCEVNHSNEDINADLTSENCSFYKDEYGEWQKATQSEDMVNAINRRVDFAKEHGARISTKGKNDTVIVRGIVVSLGDEISEYGDNTFMWNVIEILEDDSMFKKENIVAVSKHVDEGGNPHLHIAFVPCYQYEKDGELKCTISQTKFFKSPKQLAGLHKKIRKALIDKGYDIELENKPIEEHLAGYYDKNGVYHQKGLSVEMLKELSDKQIKLELEGIDMAFRKAELDKLKKAMDMVAENAKAEKEELEKERIAVENDKATVAVQLQTLIEEKTKLEKMREEVYSTAEICSNILSDEKKLNAKFMEFLDRESKRTGKKIRETVENLYKRFQNERRKNVSDWQLEMLRVRSERLKHGNINADNSMDIIDITDTGYDFSA